MKNVDLFQLLVYNDNYNTNDWRKIKMIKTKRNDTINKHGVVKLYSLRPPHNGGSGSKGNSGSKGSSGFKGGSSGNKGGK